jgi:hypothetical protein
MSGAFCETYADSRRLFLGEAEAAGARLTAYAHDAAQGPRGEPLYMDVAEIGAPDASRALLLTIGTHGLEGLAGSGLVVSALRQGLFADLGADLKVVLVHGVNPWGMAHRQRGTEHNVDLNRNFIAFPPTTPPNLEYEAADAIFSEPDLDRACGELDRRIAERTAAGTLGPWIDGVFRGQYSRPRGVAYGGEEPQWSNVTIREAARRTLGRLRYVAHVDWHTGLGGYGEPLPIAFHAPGSVSLQRLAQWAGFDPAASAGGFDSGGVPQINGLLVPALEAEIGAETHFGMVVEFGTRSNAEMFRSYILDRWMRFEGAAHPELAPDVQAELVECYYPSDPAWRAKVADGGGRIIAGVLAGLRGL